MKRLFIFFLVCLAITRYPLITGCANIVPPTGGPKDTLPPVLMTADPGMRALHVNDKKVILTFNEYIDLKDIRTQLIVSPVPPPPPLSVSIVLCPLQIAVADAVAEVGSADF